MNFIKVLDPKLQEEFAAMGFKYTTESWGDKQVYAFADSKDLRKVISEKYSNTKGICFFGDKLFF